MQTFKLIYATWWCDDGIWQHLLIISTRRYLNSFFLQYHPPETKQVEILRIHSLASKICFFNQSFFFFFWYLDDVVDPTESETQQCRVESSNFNRHRRRCWLLVNFHRFKLWLTSSIFHYSIVLKKTREEPFSRWMKISRKNLFKNWCDESRYYFTFSKCTTG